MQERGPPQAVELLLVQAQFLAQQLRVQPDAFRVAAGDPVVLVERDHQRQEVRGRPGSPLVITVPDAGPELLDAAHLPQYGEPRRWPMGERQRDVQQGRQRERPSHEPVGRQESERR